MQGIILNLILCGIIYSFLITVILFKETWRRKGKNNDSDDDDGGIPAGLPPDFDLPPGVCFSDGTRGPKKKTEREEIFA